MQEIAPIENIGQCSVKIKQKIKAKQKQQKKFLKMCWIAAGLAGEKGRGGDGRGSRKSKSH